MPRRRSSARCSGEQARSNRIEAGKSAHLLPLPAGERVGVRGLRTYRWAGDALTRIASRSTSPHGERWCDRAIANHFAALLVDIRGVGPLVELDVGAPRVG